jgi:hypothetical protein
MTPQVQVIPPGQSAIKTGQDWWRIIYQGAKISKQNEKDKKK